MERTIACPAANDRYVATGLDSVLTERGIKRAWLAGRAGISRGHMTHIVKGERTASRDVAERIAGALGLPLFLLFRFADANESFASPREQVA